MIYRRVAVWLLCLMVAGTLASCMTPQQQSDALAHIEEMRRCGVITQAQFEALKEAVLGGGAGAFWQNLLTAVGSVAGAAGYVRWTRGPSATPDERVRRKAAKA